MSHNLKNDLYCWSESLHQTPAANNTLHSKTSTCSTAFQGNTRNIVCTGVKTWKQRLGLDNQAIHTRSPTGTGDLSLPQNVWTDPRAQAASYSASIGGRFPRERGIKWPGHKTDRSMPSSSVVKNERSSTFTPIYDVLRCAGMADRSKHVDANKCVLSSEASLMSSRRTATDTALLRCAGSNFCLKTVL